MGTGPFFLCFAIALLFAREFARERRVPVEYFPQLPASQDRLTSLPCVTPGVQGWSHLGLIAGKATGVSQHDPREPKRTIWVVQGHDPQPQFNETTPRERKQKPKWEREREKKATLWVVRRRGGGGPAEGGPRMNKRKPPHPQAPHTHSKLTKQQKVGQTNFTHVKTKNGPSRTWPESNIAEDSRVKPRFFIDRAQFRPTILRRASRHVNQTGTWTMTRFVLCWLPHCYLQEREANAERSASFTTL